MLRNQEKRIETTQTQVRFNKKGPKRTQKQKRLHSKRQEQRLTSIHTKHLI